MNYLTHRFSLDVNETSAQVCLACKKNDTAIRLAITLTDKGKPYKIAEGCFAVFTATKADGTTLYNYCMIQNNTIIYTFTDQTVSCAGQVDVEIRLTGVAGVITSPSFILIVDETIVEDSDTSSSEATALIQLVENATEAVSNAQNAAQAANSAASELQQQAENGEFDGKSAYEVAAKNGFEGSEAEWLASLKGEQGEKGEKGEKGDVGGIDSQFIAAYGVTTNAEIEAAYQKGKQIMCKLSNGVYCSMTHRTNENEQYFARVQSSTVVSMAVCKNDSWNCDHEDECENDESL